MHATPGGGGPASELTDVVLQIAPGHFRRRGGSLHEPGLVISIRMDARCDKHQRAMRTANSGEGFSSQKTSPSADTVRTPNFGRSGNLI